MGQLMDYSHYPACNKAGRLVVVGDAPPTVENRSYLEFLSREYGMPIFYSCFHWDSGVLQEENKESSLGVKVGRKIERQHEMAVACTQGVTISRNA